MINEEIIKILKGMMFKIKYPFCPDGFSCLYCPLSNECHLCDLKSMNKKLNNKIEELKKKICKHCGSDLNDK